MVALETIYGPDRFTRGRAQPQEVVRQFSTEHFEAPFILHIRNGDASGEHRVSSATIRLDGVEVIRPSALNEQIQELGIEVSPQQLATLSVTLASKPESFLDIWVEGKRAATLFCPDGRPGSVSEIRQAIAQTPAGGTVAICDGTHTFRGVSVNKPITIQAAGPGTPILDPGVETVSFIVDNVTDGTVTISGLEFRVRGGWGLIVGASNDHVIVDRSTFRMFAQQSANPNFAAGGSAITATSFATPPAARTTVLEVRASHFFDGFRAVDVGNGILRAEVHHNRFDHAQRAGLPLGVSPGGRLIANHNVFVGCGDQCAGGGGASEIDFDDNQVTVDLTAPAGAVVSAANVGAVIRMNRNTIAGIGRDLDNPDFFKRYPISLAVDVASGASVTGSDNVISGAAFAFNAFGSVTMNRSDITDNGAAIGGGMSSDLRCNWWGTAAGPQNVPGNLPGSVYAPWATQPIAGTTVACDRNASLKTVRVCSVSGTTFTVPTARIAYNVVEAGGTILFCDGTHIVQNLDVFKSLTFAAEGPGMPTLDAQGALGMFRMFNQPIDVVVRGLRFQGSTEHAIHYNSNRSLQVSGSEFHPFQTYPYQLSTQNNPAGFMSGVGLFGHIGNVTIEGNTFIGGDLGVHANTSCCTSDGGPGDGTLRIRDNHFTGQTNAGIAAGGTTASFTVAVESNTFDTCARFNCVSLFLGAAGNGRIAGNQIAVDASHPVFTPINVSSSTGGNVVIEGNHVAGTGGGGDRMAPSSYPIDGFAMQISAASASVVNNTIQNAWAAVNATPTALQGHDNTISHVSTVLFGGGMPGTATAVFRRNDITDYMQILLNSPIFASVDLKCNWWGDAAGPTATGPGATPDMYTPFATAPIANKSVSCTP